MGALDPDRVVFHANLTAHFLSSLATLWCDLFQEESSLFSFITRLSFISSQILHGVENEFCFQAPDPRIVPEKDQAKLKRVTLSVTKTLSRVPLIE